MSLPPPRENELLFGHEAAESALLAAMRGGRMHHAWLITGPEGIGKATLAYRFARRLLAGMPAAGEGLALPASHPAARRIAAGTHADLLVIEREWDEKRKRMRGEIVVDTVRKLREFLHLTPAEGGWRVVIVDGAEQMNRAAANALLKLLEEPPERAILLVVCSQPGRLLPTIRSRCRLLRLEPLEDAAMDAVLRLGLPALNAEERRGVAQLAEGSPGRALMLAEGEGVSLAGKARAVVERLPTLDYPAALELADKLAGAEGEFSSFLELLRQALATEIKRAARGEASPISAIRPLGDWAEIWQQLARLQNQTEQFYLDKRQALIKALVLLGST